MNFACFKDLSWDSNILQPSSPEKDHQSRSLLFPAAKMARWSMSFSSMPTVQIPLRCGSLSWRSAQMMAVMIRSDDDRSELTIRIRVLKRRLEDLSWLVAVGEQDLIVDLGLTLKRRNQRATRQVLKMDQMNPSCYQGFVSRTSNESDHSQADRWSWLATKQKW